MRSARFLIDTEAVAPTAILRRAAESGVSVGLTHRMLRDLSDELGSYDAASQWLVDLATLSGRPVFVNVPTGKDTSSTIALAPKGWSSERLRGYVGGLKDELEAQHGPATVRAMRGRN